MSKSACDNVTDYIFTAHFCTVFPIVRSAELCSSAICTVFSAFDEAKFSGAADKKLTNSSQVTGRRRTC